MLCTLNLTTQSIICISLKINYSCFKTHFGEDFTRYIKVDSFSAHLSTPKLDIEDFVYISVICKATSVRSSVGLKYQLECDKVQRLQTHCGHALFFGGKSLYKDILFLCPQWGSGPYISRNFLI